MAVSSMDQDLEKMLVAMYHESYLIDTKFYLEDSNYLVYSAKLNCSCGSKPVYLKLDRKTDPHTGKIAIGHGFTINGLPAANCLDAKPGINIMSFGQCSLSSQGALCVRIRNMETSWTTFSDAIYIGNERGITKSSVLHCYPSSPDENITGTGNISAEDSGQMNLYQLIEDYRVDYNAMLQNSIVAHANSSKNANGTYKVNGDVMAYIRLHREEFLYLYELYYPDRKMVYDEFSKIPDAGQFVDYAKTLRFMTYMLPKDEHIIKILDMMIPGKYSLELAEISSSAPNYNASFNPNEGNGKTIINNVEKAKDYVIPFKSFFHESGHAADYFAGPGNKFLSTDFRYSSYGFEAKAEISGNMLVLAYDSKGMQAKTIHEWAENDVRNELYGMGVDFLNDPAHLQAFQVTVQDKQKYLKIVVEDYFLNGTGGTKYTNANNSTLTSLQIIVEIYVGIQNEAANRLADQDSISNLANDIYGGITGDQVGGGHRYGYWFYEKNDPEVQNSTKKAGDRKTQVSHEAFAGYFEYIVMNISAGIDPAKKVLPQTIKALEKMMEAV